MNQIPEELNYSLSIRDVENIIAKETNLHRKTQLEGVLINFRKCLYEVRYRTIDAKLKEKKINELENYLRVSNPQESSCEKTEVK